MQTLEPAPTPLHPERRRPSRRPTTPAGRAIALVLLTLLLAALLDADSLVAAVSSERFGQARSIELALVKPFRWVSDGLGLNMPHRWLADIAGTNQPNPDSLGGIGPVAAGDTGPPPTTAGITALLAPTQWIRTPRHVSPKPATTVSAPRTPRVPTAASPVTVWLAGDSLIGTLADAFIGHVTGDGAVRAFESMQIGTGLARPDVYDWPAAVANAMRRLQPQVVVLTFGANDDQDMMAGSRYLVRASPAWQAEYANRVAAVMSEVTAGGRLLVWLEVPPVARPRLQQTGQIIDAILRQEAASHHGVLLVDPGPVLAPRGTFTQYLPAPGGQSVQVRDPDGVHMTPAGAARVLPLVLRAIRTQWVLP